MERHYFLIVCLTWAVAVAPVVLIHLLRRAGYRIQRAHGCAVLYGRARIYVIGRYGVLFIPWSGFSGYSDLDIIISNFSRWF